MHYKLILYIGFTIILLVLPNTFVFKWFKDFYKKYFFKLIANHKKGKQLVYVISVLESSMLRGNLSFDTNLPVYKYYSELIYQLINDSKKFGINARKHISELRPKLIKDIKFEEKLFNEKLSGHFQFLMVTIVTWAFVYSSSKMIEIDVPVLTMIIIFCLEFIGFTSFYFLTKRLQVHNFSAFDSTFLELISFYSYLDISLPINRALADSNILNGTFSNNPKFIELNKFFIDSIARLKEKGLSPKSDCEVIIDAVYEIQEENMEKFKKQVGFLKFLHLALLFLPAYFVYLFSIFKFFVEQ